MAKESKIAANERRRKVVARYAARRAELKRLIAAPRTDAGARAAAVAELRRQPRDASATRVRNRDAIDGRPRGHLRRFGVSRVRFREMAHRGELPGVTKLIVDLWDTVEPRSVADARPDRRKTNPLKAEPDAGATARDRADSCAIAHEQMPPLRGVCAPSPVRTRGGGLLSRGCPGLRRAGRRLGCGGRPGRGRPGR